MSSHRYPRFGGSRRFPEETSRVCQATGCTKSAAWRVVVLFSGLRIDDEDYDVCEEHARFQNPDHLDDWLEQMDDEEK